MLGKTLLQKIGSSLISDHLLLINTGAVGLTFANVEQMLKILVLLLSAIYTAVKIYQMCNKKELPKEDKVDKEIQKPVKKAKANKK
tara:strand:- start:4243 stop:4500 length:258 start_codon:yes stop_codon:yes gene_type:complete